MRGNSKPAAFPKISVRNIQRAITVNTVDLKKFAGMAVRCCLALHQRKGTDLTRLREIFIWIISDRRMTCLHRQFLNKAGSTDVLTFEHGEIFISAETARQNARVFGNSLTHEIRLYVVHGLLHLHGFDDRTKARAREMEKVQQRIFRELTGW
ncbi:MAG: rRNA maturation RNase YbeY [Verrucomicrobia bacterium]|nr:MAG: rRNA maturation RNase YbeY [Verrucomicrobiota bacterium]